MKYLFIVLQSLNLISCTNGPDANSIPATSDGEFLQGMFDSTVLADSAIDVEDTEVSNPEIKTERIGTKKDSILSSETKRINGNIYHFRKYNDEGWRTGLKIVLYKDNDSLIVYDGDDSYRGGNCNITSVLVSEYEVQRDTLIIFTLDEVKEHMDENNPHYSSGTKKETYAVQKKGPIIRLKTEYGKNDSLLDVSIRTRLQSKLNECYNKY